MNANAIRRPKDPRTPASLHQPPHQRANDLVRLAERHTLRHQIVGDIGRQEQSGSRASRGLAIDRNAADDRRRRRERRDSVSSASNKASLSSCRSLL